MLSNYRELLLIGGDSAKDQMRMLQDGVDIVTGTPGRLDDFISTGKLDLSGVSGTCLHSNRSFTFPFSFRFVSLCWMRQWVLFIVTWLHVYFNKLFLGWPSFRWLWQSYHKNIQQNSKSDSRRLQITGIDNPVTWLITWCHVTHDMVSCDSSHDVMWYHHCRWLCAQPPSIT